MPETQFVTDIMQPDDPELKGLVSVRDVARYWKAEEEYVRRRLREDGVHLIRIDHPLMVRLSDVQQFEEAHTIYPERKKAKDHSKEVN
jgi:hypothetical protein